MLLYTFLFSSMVWVLGGIDVIISCTSALDFMGYFAEFHITQCYNYFYHYFNIYSCSSERGMLIDSVGCEYDFVIMMDLVKTYSVFSLRAI